MKEADQFENLELSMQFDGTCVEIMDHVLSLYVRSFGETTTNVYIIINDVNNKKTLAIDIKHNGGFEDEEYYTIPVKKLRDWLRENATIHNARIGGN